MRHDDPYLRSGIGRRPVYSEEDLEEKVRAIVSATTNQPLKLGFRDFCRHPDVTILSGMKVPTKFNKYNGIGDPTHHLTTFVAIAVDLETILLLLSFKKESYPEGITAKKSVKRRTDLSISRSVVVQV